MEREGKMGNGCWPRAGGEFPPAFAQRKSSCGRADIRAAVSGRGSGALGSEGSRAEKEEEAEGKRRGVEEQGLQRL